MARVDSSVVNAQFPKIEQANQVTRALPPGKLAELKKILNDPHISHGDAERAADLLFQAAPFLGFNREYNEYEFVRNHMGAKSPQELSPDKAKALATLKEAAKQLRTAIDQAHQQTAGHKFEQLNRAIDKGMKQTFPYFDIFNEYHGPRGPSYNPPAG